MKRVALFVGVDEYADGSISDLAYAVEDAYGLAAAFETLLGFERVERMRNPAGKKDILRKVREVTGGLGAGDLFFFYFAGHGFRVKDNHVLVCAEDQYADLEDEYDGLPVGQLKKQARGPWNRMLVLDACQNDIRASRGEGGGMAADDLTLIFRDAEEEVGGGGDGEQVVVTSCAEGQKALEVKELGHGLFTSALLETVKEHVAAKRRLDMAGFREEMGARMGALAKRYRLQGKQNPLFKVPGECGIVLLEGEAGGGGEARVRGEAAEGGGGGEGLGRPPGGAVTERLSLRRPGERVYVLAGEPVRFGREHPPKAPNDFTLRPGRGGKEGPYRRISSMHCWFAPEGDGVVIGDGRPEGGRPSLNGTWWNGHRVKGHVWLRAGEAGEVAFGTPASPETVRLKARVLGAEGGREGRASLLLERTDGVGERFLALWGCVDWGEVEVGGTGLVVFRKDGAFAWREGGEAGWLVPGGKGPEGLRGAEIGTGGNWERD